MICSRQRAGVDSLGPKNILGILTDPCSGTSAIVRSRFMVVGKPPLTGLWGDADCGGYSGPELKFAGFDEVLFTGISESPLYFLVENGKAESSDATHLRERDSTETDNLLRAQWEEKVRLAWIGPEGLSLMPRTIQKRDPAAAGLDACEASSVQWESPRTSFSV